MKYQFNQANMGDGLLTIVLDFSKTQLTMKDALDVYRPKSVEKIA